MEFVDDPRKNGAILKSISPEERKEEYSFHIFSKYYDSNVKKFCIELKFKDRKSDASEENLSPAHKAIIEFESFDEFYHYLDDDIEDAVLRCYDFNGIDLHNYNIKGAVIHSDVLAKQGLYDNAFFKKNVARNSTLKSKSPIEDNDVTLKKDETQYPRPVEDCGFQRFEINKIPFFYISDIHLWHRINHYFKDKATKEEVSLFIKAIVEKMVSSIGTLPFNSFLLFAGDTSGIFEFNEIFFNELVKRWKPDRIVVVLGNHELCDPNTEMYENIEHYRRMFERLGINYLQNELLCFEEEAIRASFWLGKKRAKPLKLKEEAILAMTSEKIQEMLCNCPLLILGGIGFSGLNKEYNASNLNYGASFDNLPRGEAREKDILESQHMDAIYKKIMNSVPKNRVIVLTHTSKDDWSDAPYNPNWVYVNGHNHLNYFEVNEQRKIYADNQIGYYREKIGLKYFYTGSDYEIFTYYPDGIYDITESQYAEFYKGKQIGCDFNKRDAKITMLKRSGYYVFLYYGKYSTKAKEDNLYLLDGGRMRKVNLDYVDGIKYYYENMQDYASNVEKLMSHYTGAQNQMAMLIKKLGGSGRIHGCIIDVDLPSGIEDYSKTHLFVNPLDGTVTPYSATNIKYRIVYKDIKSLLENNAECAELFNNYNVLIERGQYNLPVINYGRSIEEWGEDDAVFDEGGYLYRMSQIIKSLQYCSNKNIIRIWNENLLDNELVERAISSENEEEVMNTRLISL